MATRRDALLAWPMKQKLLSLKSIERSLSNKKVHLSKQISLINFKYDLLVAGFMKLDYQFARVNLRNYGMTIKLTSG